ERAFFFQAEDGIRDRNVTGVQTCALPIYSDTTTRRAPRARRAVTASPRVGEAITAWADTTSRHGPRPASSAAMVEMTALAFGSRSEEHTSELQSRFDLVCRLLLEKKNRTA